MNNFASHPYVGEATSEVTEAVGQSLNNSNQTGKKAGILLILEREGDKKYWDRLQDFGRCPGRKWPSDQGRGDKAD